MRPSLNHPNIATIHGLEESEGVHFLAMELVPGRTLAERVSEGPLGIKEALTICGQIVEALEAAHDRGVIHRDLKPDNVKVTPEGRVKVLDFGLAKAFTGDIGPDLSQTPTLTTMSTEEGRIQGTPAYMSPEQARGMPVDKRTDIWGFGCVLYELLTARRAFRRETPADTMAAILEQEPDWEALPATTPALIRNLLRRCLQKDRNLRLRDAGDARIEIQEALMAPPDTKAAPAPQRVAGWRRVAVLSLAGIALVAVTVIATWKLKPPPPQPVIRTIINLPPGQRLAVLDNGVALALSLDGTHLAYVARGDMPPRRLYVRAMDSREAKLIPGTEGATNPFFSPDGQWVGFFAIGKLKKVSLRGGAPVSLADVDLTDDRVHGASWGAQGLIAFAIPNTGGLQRVSDARGTPETLTRLEKGETDHGWPEFLPGGRALLFAAGTNLFSSVEVAVQSVVTGERRNLIQGATHPRYAPSGHLVYVQGGNLIAVPFDPHRLAVTGTPVPVVEGVMQSTISGAAHYSFSATGSLVYVSGVAKSPYQNRLVWVSRNGVEEPLAAPLAFYRNPRFSPDGRRFAVTIAEQEVQTWLYDLARGTLTRLTFEGTENILKVWTPDSKRIAFLSNKEGPVRGVGKNYGRIFWQLADGSGSFERLTASEHPQAPMSWSPDGQLLAFVEEDPTTGYDIWVLRMSDRKAQPFLRTRFNEATPRFSPDGRWLAYVSNESGRDEVYVQPYPGPGGKWQISTEGGAEPAWNPNGRELFYRSGTKMMAVEVATQPGFAAGTPRMIFEGPYASGQVLVGNYDVSPDGQRFLMLKPAGQAERAPTQINLVLNWFEELKRRVPPGK